LCAARDYIAAYLANTRFAKKDIDSMARLRVVLKKQHTNDPVAKLILDVTDAALPDGWMARMSRYRNVLVHNSPLPSMPNARFANRK
jgi:hypothetical protein